LIPAGFARWADLAGIFFLTRQELQGWIMDKGGLTPVAIAAAQRVVWLTVS
jgi:hypothetical protein